MSYHDLRDFIAQLELAGDLRRVPQSVSPRLEMTALCDRVLRAGGPAILFEQATGYTMPVLGNLFGTVRRVALGMGQDVATEAEALTKLREVGKVLSILKEPEPPKGFKDAWEKLPLLKQVKATRRAAHERRQRTMCQNKLQW